MCNGKFIGQLPENSKTICILILMYKTKGLSEVGLKKLRQLHRGAFCQFPFRRIYHYGSNKSTGKETEKGTSVNCLMHQNVILVARVRRGA